MASASRRLAHNAPGDFFVDESCIDCDTCRWMAPATFTRRAEQASVAAQPASEQERLLALQALLSCPTGSIGTEARHDLAPVHASLPKPVDDTGRVLHCGYHHEDSFGATSYLILREEGNVLVDSPRFTRRLVRRLEELGGVRTMFLTHRDDVADHARFRDHFGCERILHAADVRPSTRDVERRIEGDEPVALDAETLLIPVPGHTPGSTCLLWRDRYLFTGDHLWWSDDRGRLVASRSVCWYDWDEQVASVRRLAGYSFEAVLPGHGRRCRFPRGEMAARLAELLARLGAQPAGRSELT